MLSAEGDLKDVITVPNGESVQDVKNYVDALDNEEVIIFTTDFMFTLSVELRDFLVSYGFDSSVFNALLDVSFIV
jgi:hypothetical protein